jgi:hypothetical protein
MMSMYTMREGQASVGADASHKICIWDNLMDSNPAPDRQHLDHVRSGLSRPDEGRPHGHRSAPGMLGILDDMAFLYMTDLGVAGPDKGKGGKYLVLPPGYKGDVPQGYFVVPSKT